MTTPTRSDTGHGEDQLPRGPWNQETQTRILVFARGDAVDGDGGDGGNGGPPDEGPCDGEGRGEDEEHGEVLEEPEAPEGETLDPPEAGHNTTYYAAEDPTSLANDKEHVPAAT